MRRSHRILFLLIALLALATFAFGVLQLVGAFQHHSAAPDPHTNSPSSSLAPAQLRCL